MGPEDHPWHADGGPAFPVAVHDAQGRPDIEFKGMTLRDYFAGQALTSLLSNSSYVLAGREKDVARQSYMLADAMLAEREKDKSK